MTISDIVKTCKIVRAFQMDRLDGKKLIDQLESIYQHATDLIVLRLWEKDYRSRGIPFIITERADPDNPNPCRRLVFTLWKEQKK